MELPVDVQEWEGISLQEAANKSGLHENELYRMGARGKLPLWCWVSEKYPLIDGAGKPFYGWARLLPAALGALLLSRGAHGVFTPYLFTPDGREIRSKNHPLVVKRNFLRIMPADLEQLFPLCPASEPNITAPQDTAPESKEERDKRESDLVLGLFEREQDKDILAAVLYDEHDVPYWRVAKLLDIGNHNTMPESREKAALRAAKRGRKKIASRCQK